MKKKRATTIAVVTILVLILSLLLGTGFIKNPNVDLLEYSVSDDGNELRFTVGVTLYAGQIRGFENDGGGVKPHYLNFYHTFGVISSWGANYEYVLELDEDDTEIYFNRKGNGYELVLQKDSETGEWITP